MIRFLFHGSIWKRLILLVLFSALPSFVIVVLSGIGHREDAISRAEQDILRFAQGLAATQEETTRFVRQLLHILAKSPEVRRTDPEAASRIFSEIMKENPHLGALHLVSPAGDVLATSGTNRSANFSKTRHFRDALTAKEFVAGEFLVGVTLNTPVLGFGYPILDDAGEVQSVLLTSLKVENLGQQFHQMDFPKDSFVGACDRNGIRLYRFPSREGLPLGAPISQASYDAARVSGERGLIVQKGSDGVERIMAVRQLRLDPESQPYMYVFSGVPRSAVLAAAQERTLKDMLLLSLAVLLTIASGWLLGARALGRKLKELSEAATRIGRGDLEAAVDSRSEIDEIANLARSFNGMIEALSRDASDKAAALAALRDSEERFGFILNDVSQIAIQGYDSQRKVIFWNEASERLYGYSAREALGRRLEDLIIPDAMRQDVINSVNNWLANGIAVPAGELVLRDKQNRPVPVYSSHVMYTPRSGRKEMFCVDLDMTEIKRMQGELLKAKEDAEAASKAKSEFLANMSHEIRTPLNGVLGMLQLLQKTSPTAEQDEYIQSAVVASRRLTSLLSDILDLSKIESGTVQIRSVDFSLSELKNSVLSLFAWSAREKGIKLAFTMDEGVPEWLYGDVARLRQILFNLVGNAIKFTEQGEVSVRAALAEQDNGSRCVVSFTVSDTGIGIPAGRLQDVLEPFTQVDGSFVRSQQGAGLGLAIVKRLVDLLDGEMGITSVEGHGTDVFVRLPMRPGRASPRQPEAEPAPVADLVGLRVLLVEDERVNRIAMQRLLEKAGCSVTLAADGQEALRVFYWNEFDVVLMDIQMPVMDGVQATQLIRASGEMGAKAQVPIIALTAHAMEGDRERFLGLGMDGYLAKPLDMDELLRALSEIRSRTQARE